jgi:hypothetical protein
LNVVIIVVVAIVTLLMYTCKCLQNMKCVLAEYEVRACRICSHPTSAVPFITGPVIPETSLKRTTEIKRWQKNEFILACARVFHADDKGQLAGLDTPVPEVPEATDHHTFLLASKPVDASGNPLDYSEDDAHEANSRAETEGDLHQTTHGLAAATSQLRALAVAINEGPMDIKQSRYVCKLAQPVHHS